MQEREVAKSERATVKSAAKADRAAARDARGQYSETLIWLRDEPGGRRPVHTRADITRAAINLADADGLDAVSMRNVAQQLGTGTMTLYYYVRTKSELITLMVDAVLADLIVPDETLDLGWRDALAQLATRTRDTFAAHRWTLTCLDVGYPGPNALHHFEQSLRAVAPLRLGREHALELISQVDDYVYGFALRESQELQQGAGGWPPEVMEFFRREVATGDYPHIAKLFDRQPGSADRTEPAPAADRFQRGLNRLLDGLDAALGG
jgi:AcrR family transcriptional regulator